MKSPVMRETHWGKWRETTFFPSRGHTLVGSSKPSLAPLGTASSEYMEKLPSIFVPWGPQQWQGVQMNSRHTFSREVVICYQCGEKLTMLTSVSQDISKLTTKSVTGRVLMWVKETSCYWGGAHAQEREEKRESGKRQEGGTSTAAWQYGWTPSQNTVCKCIKWNT